MLIILWQEVFLVSFQSVDVIQRACKKLDLFESGCVMIKEYNKELVKGKNSILH
jgi:hypothetical protein